MSYFTYVGLKLEGKFPIGSNNLIAVKKLHVSFEASGQSSGNLVDF